MIINAKFASVCPCCSKPIAIGTRVEWSPGAKAMHFVCATREGKVTSAPARPTATARRSYGGARKTKGRCWECGGVGMLGDDGTCGC